MSADSDEMYDDDDDCDVSRYLRSPRSESHLLDAPEPGATTGVEHHQAPASFGFQAPTTDVEHRQPPASFGFQALNVDVDHHQVPAFGFHQPPTIDADQHQSPAFDFQAPTIGVEHHHAPEFGFQPPTIGVEHHQTPAFGLQAPTISDVVEHQQPPAAFGFQAATIDDVQHPQMLNPDQAFDLPDPMLMQAAGVHGTLAGVSGCPSLHDQITNDGEDEIDRLMKNMEMEEIYAVDGPMAEHVDVVGPVEEDDITFVPFTRGQLGCTNCRTVREVVHQSDNHKLYFTVHGAESGSFQHMIVDRTYIGADGQTQIAELQFADLRNRTHEWVQNFVASSVDMLKNDNSGHLMDSWWTSGAASSSNVSATQVKNDPHMELEIDMLNKILSAPAANAECAAPQASQPITQAEQTSNDAGTINSANFHGLSSGILESFQVSMQGGDSSSSAALYDPTQLAKPQERLSNLPVDDASAARSVNIAKADATKRPNTASASFRRLCRNDNTYRMYARRITQLNRKIRKLEQTNPQKFSRSGLLAHKQKVEMCKQEEAELCAKIRKGLQEIEMQNNGAAGPSGST
ncbi:hypothetical protein ACP70R_027264 [Stipagrostis hirtigluma subsp. patula]